MTKLDMSEWVSQELCPFHCHCQEAMAEMIRLRAINADMLAALEEIDRYSLVIESAVRNSEPMEEARAITSILKKARGAIAKAEGRE